MTDIDNAMRTAVADCVQQIRGYYKLAPMMAEINRQIRAETGYGLQKIGFDSSTTSPYAHSRNDDEGAPFLALTVSPNGSLHANLANLSRYSVEYRSETNLMVSRNFSVPSEECAYYTETVIPVTNQSEVIHHICQVLRHG